METKNGKRVLLSDDELKEVSGGWIIFAIPCKDYKEKKKCEEKRCVWSESGKCKNKCQRLHRLHDYGERYPAYQNQSYGYYGEYGKRYWIFCKKNRNYKEYSEDNFGTGVELMDRRISGKILT